MGKRMNRPCPPMNDRDDNHEEYEEINLPTDDNPDIWSIINSQQREILRLQTSNDRLLAKLLAAGVDEAEVFDQAEHNDDEQEDDDFESSPLLIILRNNRRQSDRLQRRHDDLASLLAVKEAENDQLLEESLNLETLWGDDSDMSDFLESYFQSSGDESNSEDDSKDSNEDP